MFQLHVLIWYSLMVLKTFAEHLKSTENLSGCWKPRAEGWQARAQEDQVPSSAPSLTSYLPLDHISECARSLLSHFQSRGSLLITSEDTISINIPLAYMQWSCIDVRVRLWRKLSAEELMLLNCGVGEDSWESLGLRGDPTSPFWRRSALGFLWKEWC